MIDIALDFETYYSTEYSLKKMSNAEYVLGERFESMGFSIKFPNIPARWVTGTFKHQQHVLAQIPWDQVRLIAHNARFDGSILEWVFGFKPASYLCTMVGSRPHFVPRTGSMSLEAISAYLQLPPKGQTVHQMLGKHRDDLTTIELADYGQYCTRDTENAWSIAQELYKVLPEEELQLIDLTLKKYLRPKLKLDGQALLARIHELTQERSALLDYIYNKYNVTKAMLASRPQFAQVLEFYGAIVPMKPAGKKAKKQNPTQAFAKNDPEFKKLLIHDRIEVRELSAAKLTISSSQEAARLARLLSLHNVKNAALPCPLVYYGAHTGRFSGDESINLQNLQRGSKIRQAIVAPAGYQIVAADFSQIEARIAATLAGQDDLVKGFRDGEDVYSAFAGDIYGYTINKKDHPDQRYVGKAGILSLGYGCGWERFLARMRQDNIDMSESMAKQIVYKYRERYSYIPDLWESLETLARRYLVVPGSIHIWKELTYLHERIVLPNGMPMQYPDLSLHPLKGLYFRSRKFQSISDELTPETGTRIWGGTFLENICQALARIIATRAELKLTKLGLPTALQVHDELIFVIPDSLVPRATQVISQVMCEPVDFMPGLPVAVEIKSGLTYGNCK